MRLRQGGAVSLRAVIGTLLLLVVSLPLVAQGPRRDGRWEVKIEMEGMPQAMPARTTIQCITPDDAKDPQKSMPESGRGRGNGDCKMSDYKTEGNKVSWAMKCEGPQAMSGT